MLASSGNAAACFSAYCARGGIEFIGFVRDDSSAVHCLQVGAYGAFTLVIEGDQAVAGRFAETVSQELGCLHATLPRNLYRIEGKKTAAYEIAEKLGWRAPDRVVCPTAGGTMALAMDQGFRELLTLGWIDRMPAIDVVQPEGCAPIVKALREGACVVPGVRCVRSRRVSQVPPPARATAWRTSYATSEGHGVLVSDAMNIEAEFLIARSEGLFLQPASAAAVASLTEGAERPRGRGGMRLSSASARARARTRRKSRARHLGARSAFRRSWRLFAAPARPGKTGLFQASPLNKALQALQKNKPDGTSRGERYKESLRGAWTVVLPADP